MSNYYRLHRRGLVEIDDSGVPRLTASGIAQLQRYEPTRLAGAASILVIFDIPEHQRRARQQFRATLRALYFTSVQKSVWQSTYDVLDYLIAEIEEQHLQEYVQVYESARIV